ncbi:DUF4221 family protein [Litoribacter ruber]|uniref:DUF4221 family protein n=1 Tax=Litoribacter ruber TaxID=702568 RepID=A0AAP2CHT2_9BACT|nr:MULTISPECIES: DUF4221 family protein [Litoribacter]MBS9524417.1 DUF4221 family protein [Litoribacter alkaliphilus]MBT0809785.1 DUF4221 family protein [Litoribacter ruber]
MKYLIFILLVISCTQKSSETSDNYLEGMKFHLDTVIIDPGDEIVFLNHNLATSSLSMDKKYLYNFNPNDHTLEKISLDGYQLEEKIPFEREGPNGTGNFLGGFRMYDSNEFALQDLNGIALFALDGTRTKKVNYEGFFLESNPLTSGGLAFVSTYLDREASRLFALLDQRMDGKFALGVFDLEDYSYKTLPLSSFDAIYDNQFTLQFGSSSVIFGPKMSMAMSGSRLIFSNQLSSELAIYDTQRDTTYLKEFDTQLTKNKKVNSYKQEFQSEEALEVEYTRFHQEINYLPPFWDEKNSVFYRFSFQELPSKSTSDEDIRSEIYLSVLDKNFNLIGEALVPGLEKKPAKPFSSFFPKHFAKDGKIWIYENINDELGFVILRMSGH